MTVHFRRKWRDLRNAAAFAAECARLALPFYGWRGGENLMETIQLVEGWSRGSLACAQYNFRDAGDRASAQAQKMVAGAAVPAARATAAAAYVVNRAIDDNPLGAAIAAHAGAEQAQYAGVEPSAVDDAFFRWWLKDVGGEVTDEDAQDAVRAVLSIGDEITALEIVGASQRTKGT